MRICDQDKDISINVEATIRKKLNKKYNKLDNLFNSSGEKKD